MAAREPLGLETQQPPTLVAPPLIAGRNNTWHTVRHGNATLPFVVSRPNADCGEANAVVLLLPGCGHFYVENHYPLPWQGAIEHLWSNLAFKRTILARGGLGWFPACLNVALDWTKAVDTMEIVALLQAAKSDGQMGGW